MQPRDVPVIHINTETEDRHRCSGLPPAWPIGVPTATRPAIATACGRSPELSHVSNDFGGGAPITLQLNLAELQKIPPSQLAPVGCAHQQFINGPVGGHPRA